MVANVEVQRGVLLLVPAAVVAMLGGHVPEYVDRQDKRAQLKAQLYASTRA